MRFMCLVYFETSVMAGLSEAEGVKLMNDSIGWDNDLKGSGHLILGQPLQGPETAVTIRVRNGKSSSTDGPFAETKEWLGGLFLIEAADIAEARAIAETSPIAKVASIEIRPVLEQVHSETGVGRPGV